MIEVQNLQVAQVIFRDAIVVSVAGEVDLSTAGLLTDGMTAAQPASPSPRTLVVDLSAVTFFGAAGLTSLLTADHHCRAQGITLQIVANRRAVLRPLEIAGLIKTLPVVPALRPQWTTRRRTTRATHAILHAARRFLMADPSRREAVRPLHITPQIPNPRSPRAPDALRPPAKWRVL